jgi:hypothetical protein
MELSPFLYWSYLPFYNGVISLFKEDNSNIKKGDNSNMKKGDANIKKGDNSNSTKREITPI